MFARNPKQKRLKTIFWGYLSFIILVSILPINGEEGGLNNNYTFNIRWDYLLHTMAYLPLPVLMSSKLKNKWIILISALIIAIGLEAVQLIVPFRSFNINDLIANGIGVIMGWAFLMIVGKKVLNLYY